MQHNPLNRSTRHGFTLVELLVVLALLATIAAASIPALNHWLMRDRVDMQAQTLLATFAYARSEAIRRGARITVCRDDGRQQCSTSARTCANTHVATKDWSCGYLMQVDLPSVARGKNGTQVLRALAPAQGVTIKGAATSLLFTPPAGQVIGGFRSFDIAARDAVDASDDSLRRCVRVAAGGRARLIYGPCRSGK